MTPLLGTTGGGSGRGFGRGFKSAAAPAGPSIDSTAYSSGYYGDQSNSYTHTVNSNTNGILIVCIGYTNATLVTGVSYADTPMTLVNSIDRGDYVNAQIYALSNPNVGSYSVVISGEPGGWSAHSIAFVGSSGYGATDSAYGANFTQPTMNFTTGYDNSYVVSCVSQADQDPGNVASGMTKIGPNQYYYSHTGGGAYRFVATAGSSTNSWTSGGDTNGWSMLAVEIKNL
mgnify:CR=1 FL=1|jgi:hypothetical protein